MPTTVMNRIIARVSLPPTSLVLLSIASMHCGAAFAKLLFLEVGAEGMVLMRVGFATIILFVLRQPTWIPQTQQHFKTLAAFGIVLALMNLAFYAAIERIPLGIDPEETERLATPLQKAEAEVTLYWRAGRHQLIQADVEVAR